MAMGVIQSAIGLFGNVPCPIIYGAVVDSACLIWKSVCGKHGACSLYDADTFRRYFWVSLQQPYLDLDITYSLQTNRHYGWHYVSCVSHGFGCLAQSTSHWHCAGSTGWCNGCTCHTFGCVRVEAAHCSGSRYNSLNAKSKQKSKIEIEKQLLRCKMKKIHFARFPINVYLNC